MNTQLRRAEGGVVGWIDTDITGPMGDFQDPSAGVASAVLGVLRDVPLVLVAAGGGMMSQAFPNTITGRRPWLPRG